MPRWYAPLDPNCPKVEEAESMLDDPITVAYGVGDDIWEDFEMVHRGKCARCQAYGAANIGVE